jgi:hypothetical protein
MIKQSQTQAKQAPIATIGTVDQADPIPTQSYEAEVYDPQIRQASRNHQSAQAVRAPTNDFCGDKIRGFSGRRRRFDPETFFVPIARFAAQFKVGHQEDGFEVAHASPSDDHHRAIALKRKVDIGDTHLIAWAQAQLSERKEDLFFIKLGILSSPANVPQSQRLESRLEA